MGAAPVPPSADAPRPPLVVLVVGAALLVSAGGSAAAVVGAGSARLLVLALAAATAAASAWGSSRRLRATEEVLAAAAVGLAVLGAGGSGPLLAGPLLPPAVLAGVFLALARLLPRPATWPLAAWVAAQLAVLRALDGEPEGVPRAATLLLVALAGLAVTLAGRPAVARGALATTAPWWVAGVASGTVVAWTGSGAGRWVSAALTVAAAAGLLVTRLQRSLEPLLGPPAVVPVLSGAVAGAAVAGALSSPGPVAVPLTGYAGVLLASAAALLTGWRRGLLLPAGLAAGSTLVLLCVAQLVADARWAALSLLLLATALPSALVAALRRDERPAAAPTTVGCLAGAALFAVAADAWEPPAAAAALGLVYAGSLVAGVALDPGSRHPTLVAGAVCAAAAVVLLAAARDRGPLAAQLFLQGLLTCAWAGWAWWTARPRPDPPVPSPAWRAGAAQLVVAAWTTAALHDVAVLEAWTLPLAAGLLVAAGPRLLDGPSWPAWGPGLLVAAVPSVVWSLVVPGGLRPALVLACAALVMVAGTNGELRALLLTGAGTALALAAGLGVVSLPWPAAAALAVGAALAAVGSRRERRPVAGWARRLADMR